MEACYIDKYLDTNKYPRHDLLIFNEELWNFLFSRYGGDAIKRYWTLPKEGMYTSVEIKLHQISV